MEKFMPYAVVLVLAIVLFVALRIIRSKRSKLTRQEFDAIGLINSRNQSRAQQRLRETQMSKSSRNPVSLVGQSKRKQRVRRQVYSKVNR